MDTRRTHTRFVTLVALGLVACSNDVIPSPKVPGYECGVMGVSCGSGMCCDRDQTCGIPNTASAGMCRFNGGGVMLSRDPMMTPQWKAR